MPSVFKVGESFRKVILLTTRHPKPTSAYLIDQLVQQELIDAVIVVRHGGLFEKCRRAWKITRRRGIRALLRRTRANRLRRRELRAYRDRYLVDRLFPEGVKPFQLPRDLKVVTTGRLNSRSTLAAVTSLAPTIAIQAGVGLIRPPLLEVPTIGILSLHHGIMPAIRGMDSILWSFVEDRPEWAGITVQLINEGVDTGRIIAQACIKTGPRENPFSVIATATVLGADLMARSIRTIMASGRANGWSCDESGAYRTSLTPEAICTLKRICEARNDEGSSGAW